jgi:hypothetical protein
MIKNARLRATPSQDWTHTSNIVGSRTMGADVMERDALLEKMV